MGGRKGRPVTAFHLSDRIVKSRFDRLGVRLWVRGSRSITRKKKKKKKETEGRIKKKYTAQSTGSTWVKWSGEERMGAKRSDREDDIEFWELVYTRMDGRCAWPLCTREQQQTGSE